MAAGAQPRSRSLGPERKFDSSCFPHQGPSHFPSPGNGVPKGRRRTAQPPSAPPRGRDAPDFFLNRPSGFRSSEIAAVPDNFESAILTPFRGPSRLAAASERHTTRGERLRSISERRHAGCRRILAKNPFPISRPLIPGFPARSVFRTSRGTSFRISPNDARKGRPAGSRPGIPGGNAMGSRAYAPWNVTKPDPRPNREKRRAT